VKRPVLSIFFVLLVVLSCPAETTDQKDEPQQLLALAKEVQTQQAQIVANQTNIDTKLADLAETIRVARIFAARGGRKGK
jgi:hypothetical protein